MVSARLFPFLKTQKNSITIIIIFPLCSAANLLIFSLNGQYSSSFFISSVFFSLSLPSLLMEFKQTSNLFSLLLRLLRLAFDNANDYGFSINSYRSNLSPFYLVSGENDGPTERPTALDDGLRSLWKRSF